ncbi:uncharacterized protein LOC118741287 [Rhagoletis pomonella]|uniref:uncharacterized protein LOC118741287 n=1 Tax=Rhagoletis pomonella TaxID=28610 RepID=UPI001786B6A1|nr:uncharacterized protein LOC118741287 [Rhagoletis pomonella]
MDLATVPPELEELLICSCCHLPFNDNDALPKLFTCRHYFCLKCVNSLLREGSDELYCVHCWKRTELQGPEPRTDSLPTYNAILYLTQNLTSLCLKMKAGERDRQQRSSSIASNGSTGALSGSGALNSNTNNNDGSNGNLSSIGVASNNNVDKLKMTENCMTHAMPNTLWCSVCNILLCRACAATEEHRSHLVKNKIEAKESLHTDISNELLGMQKTLNDVQHLVLKQRDFLLKILESCTTLKTQIESELINHIPTLEISEIRENLCKARICLEMLDKQTPAEAMKLYTTLHGEKQRLMAKYQEMFLQCKLDDMIRNCGYVFDFDLIKQALVQMHNCVLNGGNLDNFGVGSVIGGLNGITGSHQNPILLLANYCISQLYSRHMLLLKQQQQQQQHAQQQQQQQQQHQQQQQQQNLLTNGLLTSMISQVSLATSINGNLTSSNANFTHATYAQALQQNQPSSNSAAQQQQQANNPSSPVHKTYADIIALSNKSTSSLQSAAQQQQQQQQLLQQQQQSTGSNYTEIAPIGTPATTTATSVVVGAQRSSTASHLFSSNDLNGLGLSLLHLQQQQTASNSQQQQTKSTLLLNPSVHVYPIYYFNIEINGQHSGRILIEVRSDVAPKMAKNFNALATQELGYGYKGCHIFQCWENESIITGDFELNNGRGGRSVYDEGFFMPDDTKILAIRGSVGMRRSQKRHDNLGLVGSQFRIILREMRGFTGIFAFVVEGLDLVEKISQTGDATGKPQSSVVIVSCGKYQLG